MIFIFVFENFPNSFSWGPSFGPFWSAKYLNWGGESCEIRILPCLTQETYTLKNLENQLLLFLPCWKPSLPDCTLYGGIFFFFLWLSQKVRSLEPIEKILISLITGEPVSATMSIARLWWSRRFTYLFFILL